MAHTITPFLMFEGAAEEAMMLYVSLFKDSDAQLFTVSGLLYLVLGAAGSAILAAAWPFLIESFEIATTAQQDFLLGPLWSIWLGILLAQLKANN